MIPHFQELSRIASTTMLNGIACGTGLALLAYVVLRLRRNQSSSTRFAIWYSVLLALVLLPLVDSFMTHGTAPGSKAEITIPGTWAYYFFGAWAVIACVGLMRVGAGLWQIRKLRRSAVPLEDHELQRQFQRAVSEFTSRRTVEIRVSDKINIPTAIGFLRPMVLVPRWAVAELALSDLNAVVLHEAAHLRRWDDWSNLLQRIVGALLFFHPAVWWITNQLSLEREMACDDLVLKATHNPKAYAQCLVRLAERSFVRRGLAMAQAAVGRLRQTSLRLSQILNPHPVSATAVWKPSLVIVTAGVLAVFATVDRVPPLVAFSNQAPQIASATATPDVDYPHAKASVIQAVAHRDSFVPNTSAVANADRTVHRQAAAIPVRTKLSTGKLKPMVVRAELRPAEAAKPPDVFLVVMRSQQSSTSGATFWSISVYRLTVFHPSQQQIRNETPAKSI